MTWDDILDIVYDEPEKDKDLVCPDCGGKLVVDRSAYGATVECENCHNGCRCSN